ncbi:EpsG family protein [Niallia sp. FSL M8-0099]|uniref:EpsG family protein n=1 Tax=Niallia sp. FSL M8-0099 TaxID=2954519 RepID=UPI0030F8F022
MMGPYILVFFISFLIMVIAEYFLKKNKFLGCIYYITALILLAVFAAIRDFTVGTDIYVYGNNIFYDASHFSYSVALMNNERWGEPGYVFFNYLVGRFTTNAHIFYGCLAFITTFIAYKFFRKHSNELYVPFAMLLFLFFLYPLNFNILRQGLAISIMAFTFDYFSKGKPIKALMTGAIAFLIHDSSIIITMVYCLLFFLVELFRRKGFFSIKKATLFIIGGSLIFPLIFMQLPTSIFSSIDDKYYYLEQTVSFSNISYARLFIFAVPILYFWKELVSFFKRFDGRDSLTFAYFVTLVNIAFSAYSGSMYVLFGRGSFYFYIPFIYLICKLISVELKQSKRIIHYVFFVIYTILSFLFLLYIGNYADIFPFRISSSFSQ